MNVYYEGFYILNNAIRSQKSKGRIKMQDKLSKRKAANIHMGEGGMFGMFP